MTSTRHLLALLAVLLLAFPAAAVAQTVPAPGDGPGLSDQPPVDLGGGDEPAPDPAPEAPAGEPGNDGDGAGDAAAPREELPRTGSDAANLLLAGLSVMLIGLGLRLRTADADLY